MGADQRDWYRDWWRKKTGYTERADFRVSNADKERSANKRAWRRNFLVAGAVVAVIAVTAVVRRRR